MQTNGMFTSTLERLIVVSTIMTYQYTSICAVLCNSSWFKPNHFSKIELQYKHSIRSSAYFGDWNWISIEWLSTNLPFCWHKDPEPLTLSHLLCRWQIMTLPHPTIEEDEISDPTFLTCSMLAEQVKKQTESLQQFQGRWRREYLTSFRETHKYTIRQSRLAISYWCMMMYQDYSGDWQWWKNWSRA